MKPHDVLDFWFREISSELWFQKSDSFDQLLRDRFGLLHEQAMGGRLASWRETAAGCLAEVIVLDQFSRNMFRGTAKSFAGDELALRLAQDAVDKGKDQELPLTQRNFLYMPFMHSEDPEVHRQAVILFSQPGLETSLKFEIAHKEIIDRFGRYPHRNEILKRASTSEEIEFLKQPGSSF